MRRNPRVHLVVPGDLPRLLPTCQGHGNLDGLLQDPSASWARAAMDQWGLCGAALLDDQAQPCAQMMICPGLQLPTGHPLVNWSKTPEAAYLLALVTTPASDPRPTAEDPRVKVLVQALARQLSGQVATVEAAARRESGTCLEPPSAWLAAAGFTVVPEARADGRVRMRLDLESTVRWRPGLGRARALLEGLVPRPLPPVEPTGRDGQGS
ncbi:hypothetical protein [Luteococcus sp. OSA5]|uniref:hypothetical protein n=1 Tax=Luteococcus sp. OSA5 TaxID=3401630 RepID=UPI003B42F804